MVFGLQELGQGHWRYAAGAAEAPRTASARACSYGARSTPRSVTMAVTSRAGVTSNAGWAAVTPGGAIRVPETSTTSAEERSSIGISAPDSSERSMVEVGAAT